MVLTVTLLPASVKKQTVTQNPNYVTAGMSEDLHWGCWISTIQVASVMISRPIDS